MPKNICWRIRFSAFAHLQKAPIRASSENVPDSKYSINRQKYYYLFKKTFQVLIFEQIHINESNFGKYIFGTTERTYKICVVKTTAKMVDWCNI